jgi:uncharacterized protein (DUF362 family)
MRISRRKLVKGSLALAATALGSEGLAAPRPLDIVDVSGKDVKAMVRAALEALGGMKAFVHPGDYVVLKPNAGFPNPAAWGTTTDPEVVVAIAQLCLDARAKQVLVLESPQGKVPEKCIERCGLAAALAALPQVKLKLLGPSDFVTVAVKDGAELKSVEIAKALQSADVFINLPVAKNHTDAGVSFGLKNHMGLIKDRKAFHQQYDLQQAVADLGRVIRPHLTVLDATRALLTNGPTGPGDLATPGRIIAGPNVVSVDAYSLGVATFNNKQMSVADVRHIDLAGKAGLGNTDVRTLNVKTVVT